MVKRVLQIPFNGYAVTDFCRSTLNRVYIVYQLRTAGP